MSEALAAQSNRAFFDHIESGDPRLVKQASDTVNEFTRVKLREDGFWRKILPPIPISDDELDRQVDTDKPVKVVDKEPDSPAAMSVPFATNPMTRYIRAPRYRVMFGRIQSTKFVKDIDELRTYHMDIRQVISDNSLKDILAEEDGKWVNAVNGCLVGAEQTVPETDSIQWRQYSGAISRDNLAESLKIMPSTPTNLESKCGLINHITIKDVLKFTREEAGGDLAQDMLLNGFAEEKIMGVKWIITIKKTLVPTDTIFYFAEPRFLGKSYILSDTTMFMDKRAYMLEFFAYESIGSAIGNVGAVARADFNVAASAA